MPTISSSNEIRSDFDAIATLMPRRDRLGPHEAWLLGQLPTRRGTAIESAETIFEVEKQAVGAWFGINHRPGSERTMFWRAIDFTRSQVFVEPKGGSRARLDLPEKISISLTVPKFEPTYIPCLARFSTRL